MKGLGLFLDWTGHNSLWPSKDCLSWAMNLNSPAGVIFTGGILPQYSGIAIGQLEGLVVNPTSIRLLWFMPLFQEGFVATHGTCWFWIHWWPHIFTGFSRHSQGPWEIFEGYLVEDIIRCQWTTGGLRTLVVPLPSNSHHRDFYIFRRGSLPKPSFATGILGGGTIQIVPFLRFPQNS